MKKQPTKKKAERKGKAVVYVLDLGPVPTLAERCIRLATRLKTATRKGIEPHPLSMNECLQAARLLERYSKTYQAMNSHRL